MTDTLSPDLDENREIHQSVSGGRPVIDDSTRGKRPPLELALSSLGDHTLKESFRCIPLSAEGSKPSTIFAASISPEVLVPGWHHSLDQRDPSISLPTRRQWPPGSGPEIETRSF